MSTHLDISHSLYPRNQTIFGKTPFLQGRFLCVQKMPEHGSNFELKKSKIFKQNWDIHFQDMLMRLEFSIKNNIWLSVKMGEIT